MMHFQQLVRRLSRVTFVAILFSALVNAQAQAPFIINADGLVNGFDDWSYTTHNFANPSPVHSGSLSISVTANPYEAISFHHANFDTTFYGNFSFWVHGGTNGGQFLQVYAELNGVPQPPYALPTALTSNVWQQFTIPLSALGVANKSNFSRINIRLLPGPNDTFYVDDVQFGAKPAPALIPLTINATQALRLVDSRWFGVNLAVWDNNFDTPQSISLLNEMGTRIVRLPGGSLSDEYHWASNISLANPWQWGTSFANFVHVITNANVNAQAFITVNYAPARPPKPRRGCGMQTARIILGLSTGRSATKTMALGKQIPTPSRTTATPTPCAPRPTWRR